MTATTTETGLERHGLQPRGEVLRNPTTSLLYTHALARGDGRLAEGGPLAVDTGRFTGRSPKDKFVVREPGSEQRIWWGEINQPIEESRFDGLRQKVVDYLSAQERLYVIDAFAGADPAHRIGVRVVTASPYHALFAKTMFIRPTADELDAHEPQALVLHAPEVEADPDADGTRTGTFVVLHPSRTEVVIGGTFYAGEIKKSIFTVMNDRLPLEGVFPMHCSANVGPDGDVAIFFGLSGTGKTTLSADPSRSLIGDDEHGWGTNGVFNVEGGCYAKVIRLSAEAEPDIFRTTHTFGTILENVVIDERGVVDLEDDSKTENTRAAYELEQIPNAHPSKRAGHPRNVVFLTADAFGILPPIARLTAEQAQYWFLSGFTAKLAGTEIGVTEPQPTFSTCFGAPFVPQRPAVYATMLAEKLAEHGATVWLVNTGWTGGPFGEGHRMPIKATRALLTAALSGSLHDVELRGDPVFGFEVPVAVPGVDTALLDPRSTWADPAGYDTKAQELAAMFRENFDARFAAEVDASVAAAWTARHVTVRQLRVVVTADDYDDALGFYRDVLGLTELGAFTGEHGSVTILDAGRATLELTDPAHAAFIDQVEVGERVAGHIRIAFQIDDAETTTRLLADAGAKVVAGPTPTPWGSLNARIEGPAGLQLTLFQEPRDGSSERIIA